MMQGLKRFTLFGGASVMLVMPAVVNAQDFRIDMGCPTLGSPDIGKYTIDQLDRLCKGVSETTAETASGAIIGDLSSRILELNGLGSRVNSREAEITVDGLNVKVKIGPRNAIEGSYWYAVADIANVTYQRDFPDSVVRSGFSKRSDVGYYYMRISRGRDAAIIAMSAPTTSQKVLSDPIKRLMGDIACSTTFLGAGLSCAFR